jgi:hypothetical protein
MPEERFPFRLECDDDGILWLWPDNGYCKGLGPIERARERVAEPLLADYEALLKKWKYGPYLPPKPNGAAFE